MSLLKLDNIGKIYVSEGNVAVGIRGVTLSFDQGEFVAITGESGSGKSTLLNVLSGMDTYEEGELYIEGQPTSHYLQPDWEQYRQKYISFIFQDYNIIDSFTVLQNVELALMTIKDPKKRRERAMELIDRVGLSGHVKHKGSQLSGGQKQRTVIARALAKDSPIILADEPTGNLDSKTGQEIIELLRELSKDKLLIIVTHDFDLVENVATRHVRIFDGAVESDRMLRGTEGAAEVEGGDNTATGVAEKTKQNGSADQDLNEKCSEDQDLTEKGSENQELKENGSDLDSAEQKITIPAFSNGVRLGKTLFTSRPKLSLFLCFLLSFGMVCLFLVTALCSNFTDVFKPFYLLQRKEGRLVIARQNGEPIKDSEVAELAKRYNASDSLHFDYLCDMFHEQDVGMTFNGDYDSRYENCVRYDYDEDYGAPSYGRYPQADNEVLLRLPIYFKDDTLPLGTEEIVHLDPDYELTVVGTSFYVDTNERPTLLLTREGFLTMTAVIGLQLNMSDVLIDGESLSDSGANFRVVAWPYVDPGKIYCVNQNFTEKAKNASSVEITIKAKTVYPTKAKSFSNNNPIMSREFETEKTLGASVLTEDKPPLPRTAKYKSEETYIFLVGTEFVKEMLNECLEGNYNQASLFFENDKAAKKAIDSLRDEGFTAITTDATFSPNINTMIDMIMLGAVLGFVWIATVLLVIFMINLCTNRSVEAFRSDLAIMRSMGIPVKVIKTGMYVRMGLCLIPALLLIPFVAYFVYHIKLLDMILNYLQPVHYIFLVLGLIYLTWRITRKQVKNLFASSVKASLRGGDKA